ncbi:MAG: hypothetical protein JRN59_07160 [Nitrososphaerota archaeon]|nr:hypothetical protein [Nitrososphaerota archaeon]
MEGGSTYTPRSRRSGGGSGGGRTRERWGEPYRYPRSCVRLLAFVRLLFHQPQLQAEGSSTSSPGQRMI